MRARQLLTLIWVSSCLLAIAVVEGYFFRTTSGGVPFLLPADRVPTYQAIGAIYAANIGVLLAFWYLKPFRPPSKAAAARFLERLAVSLTIAYNAVLLYLIARGHFSQEQRLDQMLDGVKAVGGALVFLVAPVNAYYFGAPKRSE